LDLVKKVPIFQDTDSQFQNFLTLKIKPLHILDGCFIFRKDEDGQEMFFIKSGQVEIVGSEGQVFVTLSSGSFFGEIALFKSNPFVFWNTFNQLVI
jgi:CRP-like cAMP-binding protein